MKTRRRRAARASDRPRRYHRAESAGHVGRSRLGWDLETVALAGRQTRVVGHDGSVMGGMLASLWTFPEQGIVVSVTSNISYADTASLAVTIAEAFSERGKSPVAGS